MLVRFALETAAFRSHEILIDALGQRDSVPSILDAELAGNICQAAVEQRARRRGGWIGVGTQSYTIAINEHIIRMVRPGVARRPKDKDLLSIEVSWLDAREISVGTQFFWQFVLRAIIQTAE